MKIPVAISPDFILSKFEDKNIASITKTKCWIEFTLKWLFPRHQTSSILVITDCRNWLRTFSPLNITAFSQLSTLRSSGLVDKYPTKSILAGILPMELSCIHGATVNINSWLGHNAAITSWNHRSGARFVCIELIYLYSLWNRIRHICIVVAGIT